MSHKVELPSDTDLIVRALNNTDELNRPMHRLGHACALFGLDSMQGEELCRRFGFKPYESVGPYS